MQFFKNMKVKPKLMLAFGFVALNVIVVSLISLNSVAGANARFTGYLDGVGARERLAIEVRGAANSRALAIRNLTIVSTQEDRDMEVAALDKAGTRLQTALTNLKKSIESDPTTTKVDRELIAKIDAIEQRYQPIIQRIVKDLLADHKEAASAIVVTEARPMLKELTSSAMDYITYTHDQAKQATKDARAAFEHDRMFQIGATLFAIISAVGFGWILSNIITRPLSMAVRVAQEVAAGNLTNRVKVAGKDELSQLLDALNKMTDQLAHMVKDVQQVADGVAVASGEIAQGNLDLSGRTEEQASALEEASASLKELTAGVRQNTSNSLQVKAEAEATAVRAGASGQLVQQVVASMKAITGSSKKIEEIISVIDGIAFQTNILALNAAVEAARAGEQGKGFAVVATEVRSLAQRSAAAAKEIKSLIIESAEQVTVGDDLVKRAGASMAEVVGQVHQVTELIGNISKASAQQDQGISQIAQAVGHIDESTHQNAALVEESAAAAESLKQQADQLMAVVSRFKLSKKTT